MKLITDLTSQSIQSTFNEVQMKYNIGKFNL
jgi:hypothetical protein